VYKIHVTVLFNTVLDTSVVEICITVYPNITTNVRQAWTDKAAVRQKRNNLILVSNGGDSGSQKCNAHMQVCLHT
jgi:hypothetical protein